YDNSDGRLGNRDALTPANPPGYADELEFNRDQFAIGHTARLGFGAIESSVMRSETETVGRTIPGAAIGPAATWLSPADRGQPRELKTVNTVVDTKLV